MAPSSRSKRLKSRPINRPVSQSVDAVAKATRLKRRQELRWGMELGAWFPLAIAIFLTAGAVAAFALVRTGQSTQIAQVKPYNCWFANHGYIGCDGNTCAECLNGSSVPLPTISCSGLSCGPQAPAATNTPVPPTVTPVVGQPPVVVSPASSGGSAGSGSSGGGSTTNPGIVAPVASPTFAFANLPVEKSVMSMSGKANGSQCEFNKDCASKLCVPNEYGNYCGTEPAECKPGALRCGSALQTTATEKCNTNGYWQVAELCSGGCSAGKCTTTLCSARQAVCDGNNRKVCTSDGMAYQISSCPAGTSCKEGECLADSVPMCTGGSNCSETGTYCTNAEQQKYVCVDGTWKILFNGQRVGVVGCGQQKAGLYLAGLHDAADLIAGSAYLLIDCSTSEASIFNLNNSSNTNVCQIDPTSTNSFVRLSCRADAASNVIAHSARHEAAKIWAKQKGFTSGVVPSYSEAIGCRREKTWIGFQYVFHNEQPVSSIGRRDCAEAFAEAAAMYLEQPCRMKQVYPKQYGWMSTSLDSPFKGEPMCAEN